MVNFEAEPARLARLVPRGTEIDVWNGRTYISLVGFLFLDTRVLGVGLPFHRDFEEVNLRFYVRYKAEDGWRRGVTFIREIVPRDMVTWIANAVYNENYATMPMRHQLGNGSVCYEWRHRGKWNRLQAAFTGEPRIPDPGSEAEFIAEHYWGYTGQRDGGTVEYRVEHPPWRVWANPAVDYDVDGVALYGEEFGSILRGRPTSAFLAEGSPISVSKPGRIRIAGRH